MEHNRHILYTFITIIIIINSTYRVYVSVCVYSHVLWTQKLECTLFNVRIQAHYAATEWWIYMEIYF